MREKLLRFSMILLTEQKRKIRLWNGLLLMTKAEQIP